MTPEFADLTRAFTASLAREKRLTDAIRDALDALSNSSPGHAQVMLEQALRTKEPVRK